jgi:hypothetical protein
MCLQGALGSLLEDPRVDVDEEDASGFSALWHASRWGHVQVRRGLGRGAGIVREDRRLARLGGYGRCQGDPSHLYLRQHPGDSDHPPPMSEKRVEKEDWT